MKADIHPKYHDVFSRTSLPIHHPYALELPSRNRQMGRWQGISLVKVEGLPLAPFYTQEEADGHQRPVDSSESLRAQAHDAKEDIAS